MLSVKYTTNTGTVSHKSST